MKVARTVLNGESGGNAADLHNKRKHQYLIDMNRIKEVLEEKGIKQTWLAEKIGKSFSQTNAYVCNRRQPSLEVLFQIAELLNVNPKDLLAEPDKSSNE